MKKNFYPLLTVSLSLALTVIACSLSGGGASPTVTVTGSGSEPGGPTVIVPTDTLTFFTMPGDPAAPVSDLEDAAYPSTYGDYFLVNIYERPFQLDNIYRPDADIVSSSLSDNGDWYYFVTELAGPNAATLTLDTPYGIEIDVDKDGRGDFLIWATPPYSTTWTKSNVQMLTDDNNDVGGARPLHSDPNNPLYNGYETVLFDRGVGQDIDAAWVRQSPLDPNYLQIAVKKTTIGSTKFLWNPWTDFGVANPAQFDYNDFYTAQQAGSPYAADPNYPIKALFGMDNICRAAYGFTPVGTESGLCGMSAPTGVPVLVHQPTATFTLPPPAACGQIQVTAQVTDGSTWDPSWAPNVTLCINGNCQNPDASGYVVWYLPAGTYTITGSAPVYSGIHPSSATVTKDCDEKALIQFVIGPG